MFSSRKIQPVTSSNHHQQFVEIGQEYLVEVCLCGKGGTDDGQRSHISE